MKRFEASLLLDFTGEVLSHSLFFIGFCTLLHTSAHQENQQSFITIEFCTPCTLFSFLYSISPKTHIYGVLGSFKCAGCPVCPGESSGIRLKWACTTIFQAVHFFENRIETEHMCEEMRIYE